MGSGIYFPLSAIPFSIVLIVLIYAKKTVISRETRIYKCLVIINFIGLVLELLCTYASFIRGTNPILSDIILKSYLVYNVVWTYILAIYVCYISKFISDDVLNVKIKKVSGVILGVCALIIFMLECNLVVSSDFTVRYTNGPSVIFTYGMCGLFITLMLVSIIYNIHNLNNKKYIPIYVFLVTIIIGIFIQVNNPGILIMTFIETLTLNIMYFTIENPDIRVIEELSRNKKISLDAVQDKLNFLFRISNEIIEPIKRIEDIANDISYSDDVSYIKQSISVLNYETKNIDRIINDIYDISSSDEDNIKKYRDKYSVRRIYDEIVIKINSKTKDMGIKFNSNISNNVPIYLYGDFIKIKQIVFNLLNNSIKNKTSYLNINIDCITRNKVCRLIITIDDLVSGLDIVSINKILSTKTVITKEEVSSLEHEDASLTTIYKTIKSMGGNMIIKSDGHSREFIISLDELIYVDKKKESFTNYDNLITSKYKILIIDNKNSFVNKIREKLKDYDVEVFVNFSGLDAISKIEDGSEYDLIILDDEMSEISGYEVFKKLSSIKKFKTPVVISLEKDKEFIKKHYIKDGFSDYFLKSDIDGEVKRIMNKFYKI